MAKDKDKKESDRISVQLIRRFNVDTPNGNLWSWIKETFPSWQELMTSLVRDAYWPVFLASKGASADEVAIARNNAIQAITDRINNSLGDVVSMPMDSAPVATSTAELEEPEEEEEEWQIDEDEI
jgi:hypothetical protein